MPSNVDVPAGKRLVFCPAYRNKWTGKLMVAAHYGKKAWVFLVDDTTAPANDNVVDEKRASSD